MIFFLLQGSKISNDLLIEETCCSENEANIIFNENGGAGYIKNETIQSRGLSCLNGLKQLGHGDARGRNGGGVIQTCSHMMNNKSIDLSL